MNTDDKNSLPPPCGEVPRVRPKAGPRINSARSASGGGRDVDAPHPDGLAAAIPSTLPALGEGEVGAILNHAASRLHAAGVDSPRREARLLLAWVLGIAQEDIVAGNVPHLTPAMLARFDWVLERRRAREPLAYITGSREFWSLDFAVGPGVLVPRPDSEVLVEEALRRFRNREAPLRVLDLGTGSGCLLLAFLSERPQAEGLGVDSSEQALAIAARNAKTLGLEDRARFVRGDWAKNLSGVFDAILVNPPYIEKGELDALQPEVARYEPRAALCGGEDGLEAYRQVAAGLASHLSLKGRAFFELGRGQAEAVAAILAQNGLTIEGTVCDLAGIPRCLVAGADLEKLCQKKELALESRSG